MTENEINISNLSYVNKDFNTIFPELLDLVGTLTNRWDPSTSNESDPGVVLIKLMAIIADKNNYNIDKNILESFPLSVTQKGNARKLYDILGYSMNWYRSATTTIQLYWTSAADYGTSASITLPKYTTMFTTYEGDIVYTLTENVILSYGARRATGVNVIQGVCKDYEINGTNIITLDNLDENRRIYFTETQIAQNGIFVYNYNDGVNASTDWTRVDNLEIQESKTKAFKFGVLPNSDTCYIEFPLDIASIIGSGLCIKYVISSGAEGNVKANTLTSFYSDNAITVDGYTASEDSELTGTITPNEAITVRNDSSATNGADPETLNDAYNNFKKTIGTFETLVSCRDYDNYIYNIEDDNGYYVSNAVTSDRTNDLNFTDYVMTLLENGISERVLYKQAADINNTTMTPYDLCLRLLEFVLNITNEQSYNRTFSVCSSYDNVEAVVDESKCISHEYFDIANIGEDQPFILKNFYKLIGSVITYYKVSETEAKEIENNIKLALMTQYNARNVNFGEPVIYEDLINTIQNSDTRIKTVVLNEPTYELRYMKYTDEVGDYNSSIELSDELKQEFLARLVASGNVQLFDFDLDFRYDFGQESYSTSSGSSDVYNNIVSISSSLSDDYIENTLEPALTTTNAPPTSNDAGYVVRKNENIMLYAPNLYTKTNYSAYVNYRWESANASSASTYSSSLYNVTIGSVVFSSINVSVTLSTSANNNFTITTTYRVQGSDSDATVSESGTWSQAQNSIITLNITEPYKYGETSIGNEARSYTSSPSTNGRKSFAYQVYLPVINLTNGYTLLSTTLIQGTSENTIIAANEEYQLKSGDNLYINYTDSDNVSQSVRYGPGTIIKPSMDLIDIRFAERIINKQYVNENEQRVTGGFVTMGASDSLEIRAINEQEFASDILYCIWFTNDVQTSIDGDVETTKYTLFPEPVEGEQYQERVLQNNEYFLYTNQTQDVLYILGSGTKLTREVTANSTAVIQTRASNALSLNDINNNGLSSISETSWYTYRPATQGKLVQTELQIITLGEGARLAKYTDSVTEKVTYYYKNDANDTTENWTAVTLFSNLTDTFGKPITWEQLVTVNIEATTSTPQEVLLGQIITLNLEDGSSTNIEANTTESAPNTYLAFNSDVSLTGGSNVSTSVTTLEGETGYYLSAYAFKSSSIDFPLRALGEFKPVSYDANIATNDSMNFGYRANTKYLIPISVSLANSTVTLNPICSEFDYNDYINSSTSSSSVTLNSSTSGIHYILVNPGTTNQNINIIDSWRATASTNASDDYISFGNIYKITNTNEYGVSEQIANSVSNVRNFLANVMSQDKFANYDITYLVDDVDAIDTDLYDSNGDVFSANAIWDSNNFMSRFTIPQMKTDKNQNSYYIKVASSSKS